MSEDVTDYHNRMDQLYQVFDSQMCNLRHTEI